MLTKALVSIGVIALLCLGAWALLGSDITSLDANAIAARIRAAGLAGHIGLFALLVLQCVVAPLPSEPLMMAAGFLYGPRGGFALAWVGVTCGALACFFLAQTVGAPLVHRFVDPKRLAAFQAYFSNRSLLAAVGLLLFVRLFAFSSFDVISYGCGLLQFPFRWFALVSAVGVTPKVFAFTYLGASAGPEPGWLNALIAVGMLGILIVVPWIMRRATRSVTADREI